MITLEYIAEQRIKYQGLVEYYQNLGFERLASEFKNMIDFLNAAEELLIAEVKNQSDDNSQ